MSSGKVNIPVLVGGLLVVIPLVVVMGSGFFTPSPMTHRTDILVGKPAPAIELEALDGSKVSLASLAGSPVVVNFWSTWCGPCKYEHPLLQNAARANSDVTFLGVIYSDEPAKARIYLAREGAAYANLVDAQNRVAIDYGVTGVPETFFIAKDGTIAYKHAGPLDPRTLSARLQEIQ